MNIRCKGLYIMAMLTACCISMKGLAKNVTKNESNEKDKVERTVRFEKFVPAVITLSSGKKVANKQANILLTNSSLVYKQGWITMQAEMTTIKAVDIQGVHYDCIDTLLVEQIDTLNDVSLYQATLIDVDAYRNNIRNQQKVDNLEIGSFVNINSVDLSSDDDKLYPLMYCYFFKIKGKFVKAHERNLNKHLNTKQKRMFQVLMEDPDFSFSKRDYMSQLLKIIGTY